MCYTYSMEMQRVRITRTVWGHLEGSGLFQGQRYTHDDGEEAVAQSFRRKVENTPARKDGSTTVDLTEGEREVLRGYTEHMFYSSRDAAGYSPEARGEMNAARALLRKLER